MNQNFIKCMSVMLLVVSSLQLSAKKSKRRLEVCDQAPIFKATALYPDGVIGDFDLKKYLGKKIVLYFYPFDSTPVCTKQAKSFIAGHDQLHAAGIQVIGVSCDSPYAHKRFVKRLGGWVPFPMVSDSHLKREISMMYNVAGFFSSKRKTFLIDEQGKIVHIYHKVDVDHQVEDILSCFNECDLDK